MDHKRVLLSEDSSSNVVASKMTTHFVQSLIVLLGHKLAKRIIPTDRAILSLIHTTYDRVHVILCITLMMKTIKILTFESSIIINRF